MFVRLADGRIAHQSINLVNAAGYVPTPQTGLMSNAGQVAQSWYYNSDGTPANQRSIYPVTISSYLPPVITIQH